MAINFFWYRFRSMQVYGLVGPSGTGKSFKARQVLEDYNIDLLIDDGLVIQDQKILAGISAKSKDNIIDAVGTAIFEDNQHRDNARRTLEEVRFKKILILGTSERMIHKICDALYLHRPHKIINIRDIATDEEIAKAQLHRNHDGGHVVPIPSFELKQSFPELLVDSLDVWIKRGFGLFKRSKVYQKSLVRPVYSKRDTIMISDQAMRNVIEHTAHKLEPNIRVTSVSIKKTDETHDFQVMISVPISGVNLNKTLPQFHERLYKDIQKFSGLVVRNIQIIIDGVDAVVKHSQQRGPAKTPKNAKAVRTRGGDRTASDKTIKAPGKANGMAKKSATASVGVSGEKIVK